MGLPVLVMGESGSGKTASLRNFKSDEVFIINIAGKELSFKNINGLKRIDTSDYDKVKAILLKAANSSENKIKSFVLDDTQYLMAFESFARAKETGYGKYTDIGLHTQQVIEACEKARQDLNIFLIYHSEEIQDNGSLIGYKVATVGKLLDQTYNPVEVVPIVLFSDVKFMEDGTPQYGFYTKRTKIGGVTIPAKSPDGMFDDNFIPNDLGLVIEKMNQYFA